MILTEMRRGEVAIALVRAYIREHGLLVRGKQAFRSELGRVAKQTGVSADELREFFAELAREAMAEMFAAD